MPDSHAGSETDQLPRHACLAADGRHLCRFHNGTGCFGLPCARASKSTVPVYPEAMDCLLLLYTTHCLHGSLSLLRLNAGPMCLRASGTDGQWAVQVSTLLPPSLSLFLAPPILGTGRWALVRRRVIGWVVNDVAEQTRAPAHARHARHVKHVTQVQRGDSRESGGHDEPHTHTSS